MAKPNFASETIWSCDNLPVLRGMNSNCVDLIYLDPPFNSNRNYEAPIGSKAAGAAFKDAWTLNDIDIFEHGELADHSPAAYRVIEASRHSHGKGMMSYLIFMAVRLLEMQRILKPTGSIYLHCDPTASHYLKLLMDSIFGVKNFRNEIIWNYSSGGASKSAFAKKHDIILFYTKSQEYTFNILREPYASIVPRGNLNFHPEGRMMKDVWEISIIQTRSKERTGYPTQKPLALLDRIIRASSNERDLVLDPFCGCATTLVAADRLERRWAGIDLSPLAIELVDKRINFDRGALEDQDGNIVGDNLFGGANALNTPPQREDLGKVPHYRTHSHALYGKQEGICVGCSMHFPFKIMQVDHIVPKSRGGGDNEENLQLLCSHCNMSKGNKTMAEWRASQKKLV